MVRHYQAGTPYLALVERKAEWPDQVEPRACCETGLAGVSGVPVYLGIDEYNVSGGHAGASCEFHGYRMVMP